MREGKRRVIAPHIHAYSTQRIIGQVPLRHGADDTQTRGAMDVALQFSRTFSVCTNTCVVLFLCMRRHGAPPTDADVRREEQDGAQSEGVASAADNNGDRKLKQS